MHTFLFCTPMKKTLFLSPAVFHALSVRRGVLLVLGLVVLLLGSGCATVQNHGDSRATIAQETHQMERFNRSMYQFNEALDSTVAKPIAQGYEAVTPRIARTGVRNFFGNIRDYWSTFNQILQLRPLAATKGVLRSSFNTVLGLGGFIDISTEMGLYRDDQDLGKTLGRWGVESGPYIVLPVLGPSTLRDVAILPVEQHFDLVGQIGHVPSRNSLFALRMVDKRANLLGASDLLGEAALDGYVFTRNAFLQKRQNDINSLRQGNDAGSGSSADEDEFL